MTTEPNYEHVLNNVNTFSNPADLRITDMRFTDITGAPMHCTLMKITTNQGLVGYGEVRDAATKTYALTLKRLILGENPCNVDKIFRRIKQFGGQSRQGGGVSGVEVALWDLAGKAFGVPVYQMLGGKFRDKIRIYCDTDLHGKPDGIKMGNALKDRMQRGFTFLKMDVGIGLMCDEPGTLCYPLGLWEEMQDAGPPRLAVDGERHGGAHPAQPRLRYLQRPPPLHRHPPHRERHRPAGKVRVPMCAR